MPSRKQSNVTLRKDGLYQASKVFGYKDNGKPNRKTFYGKTQREALEKLNAYAREVERGRDIDMSSYTVKAWVELWLTTYKLGKLKPHTYDTYELLVNNYIIPRLGNVQIDKLKPTAVQGFVNGLSDALSPSTVKQTAGILKRALEQAYKNRLIVYNPAAGMILPKAEKVRKVGAFTIDEQRALLHACAEHRLYALFVFALGSGCRVGEILALRWDNVNLDDGTVRICESVSEAENRNAKENAPKTKRIISDTKTAAGNRTIPLISDVFDILKQHRERQQAEKQKADKLWVDNDLVFCTATGGYLMYRNIRRLYDGFRDKAEIKNKLSFHCLRHTFATNAIGATMDYYYLSRIMGHSKISVTLDMYADFMPDKAREEIQKMECVLPL
jgi:Site-specific recombinase XerD